MNFDRKVPLLFTPPVLAAVACLAFSLALPDDVTYRPAQPEFLTSIDRLSLFTMADDRDDPAGNMRDVFRHEWMVAPKDPSPPAEPEGKRDTPPVKVTMIVDSGDESFCIVNGRKMRTGDRADGFSVTSIGKDHVIITHKNGTRENHHVKAY